MFDLPLVTEKERARFREAALSNDPAYGWNYRLGKFDVAKATQVILEMWHCGELGFQRTYGVFRNLPVTRKNDGRPEHDFCLWALKEVTAADGMRQAGLLAEAVLYDERVDPDGPSLLRHAWLLLRALDVVDESVLKDTIGQIREFYYDFPDFAVEEQLDFLEEEVLLNDRREEVENILRMTIRYAESNPYPCILDIEATADEVQEVLTKRFWDWMNKT